MKILFLDIETSPNIVYVWGLFNQNIALNQIVAPGETICWAARWGHERKIQFRSVHHHSASEMVQKIWELLDEADVVVHFNGTRFDIPTLNKEFILRGMQPPTTYKEIDLYRVVRSRFRFASNKLDFVAQELGLGAKTQHKGMDLWKGCMEGVEADWVVMKRYNIQDVRLLPKLYQHLLGWIKGHPNMALYIEDDSKPVCRNCGSEHITKRGVERTTVQIYQRYKCVDCGWNGRGRYRLHKPGDGVLV